MAIIAKSSNTKMDSFWEAPQVAESNHLQIKDGWYILKLVKGFIRKNVYRSEIRTKILKTFYKHTVGFTFEIGTDHKTEGGTVIYQVWEDGSPSNSIQWNYKTNEIFYRVSGPKPTFNKVLYKAEIGKSNRIVFEIDGKRDNTGRTRIHVDGKLVLDFKGRNLYGNPKSAGYIKFGMYDDDVDEWPSNLPERSAKFKDIVIADYGTDLNEVGLTVDNSKPIDPNPVPENPEPDTPSKEVLDLSEEVKSLRIDIASLTKEIDLLQSKIRIARNILE